MKAIKNKALLFLFIFVFSNPLFASSSDELSSIQLRSLMKWRISPEAQAVQQSLHSALNQTNPRNKILFEKIKNYPSLFKKPFLILDARSSGFGGFFAVIVFKGRSEAIRFWIYEIDDNVFEVREAIPIRHSVNPLISKFEDQRLIPFWQELAK
jgi:hypothetical protein